MLGDPRQTRHRIRIVTIAGPVCGNDDAREAHSVLELLE
jgi:hypothetical protein